MEQIRKFIILVMVDLCIGIVFNLFSLNIVSVIFGIILIVMNYIFLSKIDSEDPSSLIIGLMESIFGIIVGGISGDIITIAAFGVLLVSIITFFIGATTNNLEERWFKVVSDVAIVISVFLLIVLIILTKAGFFVNISKIESKFNSIEQTDTVDEIQKKLGKKGEIQDNVYFSQITRLETNFSDAKNIKIKVDFLDNKVTSKELSYDSHYSNKLFGNSKIRFSKFQQIKTKADNEEELSYAELRELLGNKDDGILIGQTYSVSILSGETLSGYTYIFADKEENYIEVKIFEEKVSSMQGWVNGQRINLKF